MHTRPSWRLSLIFIMLVLGLLAGYARYHHLWPSSPEHKTHVQHIDWHNIQIDEVRVYKSQRQLQLRQNGRIIKTYAMRLGFDPVGHKTTEGDGKTPEGEYVLDWRNPRSQFYKSLHVSYPNAQDLAQAQARGVSAGGDIMIHGSSRVQAQKGEALYDYLPQNDWTWGCIAVSNEDMDEIWNQVKNGTKIVILA